MDYSQSLTWGVKKFGCISCSWVNILNQKLKGFRGWDSSGVSKTEFLVHFLQTQSCPTLIMSCLSLTKFYEGYGQTECTAGCCLSLPGDWTAGMVGRRAISRVSSLEFKGGVPGNRFLIDRFVRLLHSSA